MIHSRSVDPPCKSSTVPPSSNLDNQELHCPHTLGGSCLPALDVLRMVIQLVRSPGPAPAGRGAFALGPRADVFLRGRHMSNEDLLKILHALSSVNLSPLSLSESFGRAQSEVGLWASFGRAREGEERPLRFKDGSSDDGQSDGLWECKGGADK